MKCKFCSSPEELKWPENYKKGNKPVNAETNQPHVCIKKEPKESRVGYFCGFCNAECEHCEDLNCAFCKTLPEYCVKCHEHPRVVNVRDA